MKKKIILIVSLCIVCIFALNMAACGGDPTTADYNGVTYDELKSNSEGMASTLVAMKDTDIESYLSQSTDTITTGLLESWKNLQPKIGEYVDLGEFSVSKSGKTLTTTQILNFTKRDVTLTCVFKYSDMSVTGITLDENYTLAENMQKALMNTLMGMGSVFGILILISLIIWAFKFVKAYEEKSRTANAPVSAPALAPAAPVVEAEPQDDFALIAVITAAIAAAQGDAAPADGFVVRSIKRRK